MIDGASHLFLIAGICRCFQICWGVCFGRVLINDHNRNIRDIDTCTVVQNHTAPIKQYRCPPISHHLGQHRNKAAQQILTSATTLLVNHLDFGLLLLS